MKRVLERVWNVYGSMSINCGFLIFLGVRSSSRTRFKSTTLSEEMKLWPFVEWVLLNSAWYLIRVALDLLVADVQVLLYVETAVEID